MVELAEAGAADEVEVGVVRAVVEDKQVHKL